MYGGLAAHMAESWKQWEGTVVDQFRLEEYLGGSDHSAVFATHFADRPADRIAIKFVPVTPENLELQRVSWESAARVAHPHLLQLHGTGRCRLGNAEFLYLVMDYAEENLAQILPERSLTPDEAREMLPAVLETLSHLHQKGLVHGALKPANILAANDTLKLASDHVWPVNLPFPALPHSACDAPEVSQGKISPAADIWALGATLMEVLTRRTPNGNAPSRSTPVELVPPFDTIVGRCLEADPEKRCALTDILRALQAPPVAAAVPPATAVPAAPASGAFGHYAEPSPSSGARLLKLAGAFLLVLAAIYFGSRIFHGRAEEPAATTPAVTQPASSAAENAATPASNTASVSSSPPPAKAANLVSKRGAVLETADPGVSAGARATITGKIRVRARAKVDASGNVSEAHLESAGPSRYFANKALESARRWKFTPPTVDGQPVPSEWRLHFEFSRTGTHMGGDPLAP
jgi:TonB family protein